MRSLIFLIVLVLIVPGRAQEPRIGKELKLSDEETQLIERTNAERVREKRPALKPNPLLLSVARSHAENMARQEKLSHELDRVSASERVTRAGYKFQQTGENIGWNYATPHDAVTGWMNSDGHRANILESGYTEIGVAVAKSARGERYWVQVFAAPLRR